MIKWIKDKWNKFNNWVAKWAPGFKTQLILGIGIVGEATAALQQFITDVPMDKFVSGTSWTIFTVVIMALAFWARQIGKRVSN